jgi:hypothetical protein
MCFPVCSFGSLNLVPFQLLPCFRLKIQIVCSLPTPPSLVRITYRSGIRKLKSLIVSLLGAFVTLRHQKATWMPNGRFALGMPFPKAQRHFQRGPIESGIFRIKARAKEVTRFVSHPSEKCHRHDPACRLSETSSVRTIGIRSGRGLKGPTGGTLDRAPGRTEWYKGSGGWA